MPRNFMTIRMHVGDETADALDGIGARSPRMRGAAAPDGVPAFTNDEAAARYYLSRVFQRDVRPAVRGLTAPTRPEVVPDLRVVDVRATPQKRAPDAPAGPRRLRGGGAEPEGGATLVRFEQTKADLRVFGSRASVELDANRELLSIDATVADVGDVSAKPALRESDALRIIAETAGVDAADLADVAKPELTFFNHEERGTWHLAWFFRKVPAAPRTEPEPGAGETPHRGHGLGRSPRDLSPRFDWLIDAHDGGLLLWYSSAPTVVLCRGLDEEGAEQRFFGNKAGQAFELYDPLRSVRTFDLGGGDITGPLPDQPVSSEKSQPWAGPAAVSAHVNATRVQQFFSDVLGRNGVDDKGMELLSMVNCTYRSDQPPPEWHNAVWYDNRMWYGQIRDGDGRLRSYARHLDIIAHELMHGVTEHTADLVYKNQPGALNESFSDIFGIIIKNWYTCGADSDATGWEWELGPGLGDAGKPLRDLADPRRTGDPDHMRDYLNTRADEGGVHTNSNIHNKAACNLLRARDAAGGPAMLPSDVAVLYYLTLLRLSRLAGFGDTRRALIQAAKTYFGDPAERERMLGHIEAAYDAVGIT